MTGVSGHVPALAYHRLTRWYDPVMRWTMRERAFKEALLRAAALRPGEQVLDLGCGTATLTIAAARLAGRAAGVDADEQALAIARVKVARAGAAVELHRARAQDLPFPDKVFDVVLSSLFFHHLDPPAKSAALAEARRVLRPGGRLAIADWGAPAGPLMALAFHGVQWLDGKDNTEDHRRGRLPAIVSQAGFVAVERGARCNTMFGTVELLTAERPA